MIAYIIRRIVLIPLTLFGIIALNFVIVQFAPGGPVEQVLAQVQGLAQNATSRFSGGGADIGASGSSSTYRGAQGLDPEFIKEIERQFGFDKPPAERFILMVRNYMTFDLGESYFRSQSVISLIADKLPVSISLGVWSTLIIYLISIPLGIAKAVRDGSRFDVVTSYAVFIGYAMPSFIFAILYCHWRIFFNQCSCFFFKSLIYNFCMFPTYILATLF